MRRFPTAMKMGSSSLSWIVCFPMEWILPPAGKDAATSNAVTEQGNILPRGWLRA